MESSSLALLAMTEDATMVMRVKKKARVKRAFE
jgi:hypothetical protein